MIATITAITAAIAAKMFGDLCDHKETTLYYSDCSDRCDGGRWYRLSSTIVEMENMEIGSRKDRCPFSTVIETIVSILWKYIDHIDTHISVLYVTLSEF